MHATHVTYKYQKKTDKGQNLFIGVVGEKNEKCRANLRKNIFDLNDMNPNIQILQENEHTHEEDDDMIGNNEALNQMKGAVREDPTVPIKIV
jgi:hypothetical protein